MTEPIHPPAKAGDKQAEARDLKGRFRPGVSGNAAGRRQGSRHKATRLVEALFEDGARVVATAVLDAAKTGDLAAAKLVIERLLPPLRRRPAALSLPPLASLADVPSYLAALAAAIAQGDAEPETAEALARLADRFRAAVETAELVARVERLEASTDGADSRA